MADREEADVQRDMLHPVEEEDDAEEEEDMVVTGDHMLRAEIHEGEDVHPADLLDISLVTFGDGMGHGLTRREDEGHGGENEKQQESTARTIHAPWPCKIGRASCRERVCQHG